MRQVARKHRGRRCHTATIRPKVTMREARGFGVVEPQVMVAPIGSVTRLQRSSMLASSASTSTPSPAKRPIQAPTIFSFIRCGALALSAISCGTDPCLIAPCPLPFAVTITVTSSISGASVNGSFVQNPPSDPLPCNGSPGTTCAVFGSAGTYQLDIGAPGFQTVHRTVEVQGTTPECGCPTVETTQLDVALVPAP